MRIFQRVVLLIKVLVMLSLGTSAAWAHNLMQVSEPGYSSSQSAPVQMLAKSESEPGDQGQGGSADDDDSTTDEPDSDEAEGA